MDVALDHFVSTVFHEASCTNRFPGPLIVIDSGGDTHGNRSSFESGQNTPGFDEGWQKFVLRGAQKHLLHGFQPSQCVKQGHHTSLQRRGPIVLVVVHELPGVSVDLFKVFEVRPDLCLRIDETFSLFQTEQ